MYPLCLCAMYQTGRCFLSSYLDQGFPIWNSKMQQIYSASPRTIDRLKAELSLFFRATKLSIKSTAATISALLSSWRKAVMRKWQGFKK